MSVCFFCVIVDCRLMCRQRLFLSYWVEGTCSWYVMKNGPTSNALYFKMPYNNYMCTDCTHVVVVGHFETE